MKREDLFLAIGEVEGSRLLRSELTVQEPSDVVTKEESDMKKKRVNVGRIIRNILVAALIISMLGVTAYAVGGFIIFDSPEEMLTSIFGDQTGFDHAARGEILDKDGNLIAMQPRHDRVPVDETVVAEDVAPYVSPVGQSISWNGYTLTVDAFMYDSTTQCGLLTYTLENPDGLDYSLQSTGEVWFPSGEILEFSQYGYSYIMQEKTTDTKLAATYYYQLRDMESTDLVIGFTQWASITQEEINQKIADIKQQLRQEISEEEAYEFQKQYYGTEWEWFEANRTKEEIIDAGYEVLAYERLDEAVTCPDKITVYCPEESAMDHVTLGNGSVTISPITFMIDITDLEYLHTNSVGDKRIHAENVQTVTICYSDGTEYIVRGEGVDNTLFGKIDLSEGAELVEVPMSDGGYMTEVVNGHYSILTYMFNRIIDVDKVESVIVNGVELPVD